MSGSQPLTPDEKVQAFSSATSGFPKRYAEQIAKGMTDSDLENALNAYLGIFGGSGGPDQLDVTFQGAGLKIWAARTCPNHILDRPIFQGKTTVAMTRHMYNIFDPSDTQLSLI